MASTTSSGVRLTPRPGPSRGPPRGVEAERGGFMGEGALGKKGGDDPGENIPHPGRGQIGASHGVHKKPGAGCGHQRGHTLSGGPCSPFPGQARGPPRAADW